MMEILNFVTQNLTKYLPFTKILTYMHDFKKLLVWKKARVLVKDIYIAANKFPRVEERGLSIQMKRCSVSIPSNIAEGCGRGTKKQLNYFLDVSLGSAYELETQILLGTDLEYIDQETSTKLINQTTEVCKMLAGFKKSL